MYSTHARMPAQAQALTRVLAAAAVALICSLDVQGAETPAPPQPMASQPMPMASQPMNMDEPMAGGMKKPGMVMGDVKKAAEKKEPALKAMIEKDERSMPQGAEKK